MIAFQFAADIWGATLDSNVTIVVNAAFNPLGTNVPGSAGPTFVFSDFAGAFPSPGAQFANTWYHSARADFAGQTDGYSQYTFDNAFGLLWPDMTAAQRQASAINFSNLVWVGPNVTADVPSVLNFGSPFVKVVSPAPVAGFKQFGTAAFALALDSKGEGR